MAHRLLGPPGIAEEDEDQDPNFFRFEQNWSTLSTGLEAMKEGGHSEVDHSSLPPDGSGQSSTATLLGTIVPREPQVPQGSPSPAQYIRKRRESVGTNASTFSPGSRRVSAVGHE